MGKKVDNFLGGLMAVGGIVLAAIGIAASAEKEAADRSRYNELKRGNGGKPLTPQDLDLIARQRAKEVKRQGYQTYSDLLRPEWEDVSKTRRYDFEKMRHITRITQKNRYSGDYRTIEV